jgi:predicted permease
MGFFSLWNDEVSIKLEGFDKDAANMWRITNLLAKLSILSIIAGISLLVIGASLAFLAPSQFDRPVIGLLAIVGLLLFILVGVLFSFYTLFIAVLALIMKDLKWGAAVLLIGLPALFYKWMKKKEILEKIEKWKVSAPIQP